MAFDLLRSNSSAGGREWDDLYRVHAADLRRLIARRVPVDAPVDDLLQEVFYQAYRSRHRVDLSQPVWSWLATIAHRVCIAWWRRQRVDGVPWDAEEQVDSAVFPGSDEHIAALVQGDRVSTALARLSPRHRFLLVNHTAGELSCEHLARSEGTSAKAVKSALGRARTEFRRHMEGLPVAAGACRRWYARNQRVTPVAEGMAPWMGAFVTLGVVAALSVAPVAMRSDRQAARAAEAEVADAPGGGPDAEDPQTAAPRPAPAAPEAPPSAPRPPGASSTAPLPSVVSPGAGAGVKAAGVATHADVTQSPEGVWTIFEINVDDPIARDTTVGASVRCTSGAVATLACGVGQPLAG